MSKAGSHPLTREMVLAEAWYAEGSGQHRLADLLYAAGGMMTNGFKDAITPTDPGLRYEEAIEEYAAVGRRIARESIGGR